MVDGGILPALELDGMLYTKSLNIMKLLDVTFEDNLPRMIPSTDTREAEMADSLLELERKLQSNWFSLTFENLDCWLAAFEERLAYLASKSDYYTLCMAIPSQNGPGYFVDVAKDISYQICGLDGAWELPLVHRTEPLAPAVANDESARREAAYKLIGNYRNVINFACRGAGEPGRPSFHAELADPYAEPNEEFFVPVDVCLRHDTAALLVGIDNAAAAARRDLSGRNIGNDELRPNWEAYKDDDGLIYFWNEVTGRVTWTAPTRQLDSCLGYLRDRIGVPRDMGQAAAMQLRAHLNWAIALLR